jgi:hypothetical protein
VAVIRTLIFASYLTTNLFIVAGVIRHWNNDKTNNEHGNIRTLRRDIHGEEATLGDVCLFLTNGRSRAYHISDAGGLRCRDAGVPQRAPGGMAR